jgi:hypothetical protein
MDRQASVFHAGFQAVFCILLAQQMAVSFFPWTSSSSFHSLGSGGAGAASF